MINPVIIDRVFEAAAIEEVVGEYVSLKKSGSGFLGLCPFHDDKHPSMNVSPSKGIFKCFSCGKGGNVAMFIMEHESLSYPAAIRFLAKKYNIPVEEDDVDIAEIEEDARLKEGLFACLEFAKNTFKTNLLESEEGKIVYLPYLKERGIREDTINRFELGLSGTGRTDLLSEGLKNGYTAQQLFQSGLVKKLSEEEGVLEQNLRDTFIERIVFPIQNISGKVLGFGGRIIKTNVKAPKYLNSPETILYEKRKELYGLFQARNQIRKEDKAYLVEGYMDVISLSQAGIENVVAVSGTAFTEEQARLLKRFCQNIVLLFDGDEAGINASLKHIETLIKADFNVEIVLFPEGEDPDSFVQSNGLTKFNAYVQEQGNNFVEFIAKIRLKGKENDPVTKAETAKLITKNIALLADPLKRTAFINLTAKILGWEERVLIDETNKNRIAQRDGYKNQREQFRPHEQVVDPDVAGKEKKNYQEFDLLRTLILFGEREYDDEFSVTEFIFKELEDEDIWPESDPFKSIFKDAFTYFNEHKTLSEQWFTRNPACNEIAADVLTSTHALSDGWEKNYEKYVPTEEKNYKKQVIENLNYLKLHRIEQAIRENQEKLKMETDMDEIVNLQLRNQELHALRQKLASVIGAVVL